MALTYSCGTVDRDKGGFFMPKIPRDPLWELYRRMDSGPDFAVDHYAEAWCGMTPSHEVSVKHCVHVPAAKTAASQHAEIEL